MTSARRDQLAVSLARVSERVAAAANAAGRDPASLQLIAVSKTWPASDVVDLAALGVTDFGENKDQEARPKVAEVQRDRDTPVTWHFLGRLQRNKCRSVARWADWVHSVDRDVLVPALDHGAAEAGRILTVCVQVSLAPSGTESAGRGGVPPADVPHLADLVASCRALVLAGVMAVAPREGDPAAAFARLRTVSESLRRDHPEALVISAGMSGDLEAAVAEGATHLRVGTALFGGRAPVP